MSTMTNAAARETLKALLCNGNAGALALKSYEVEALNLAIAALSAEAGEPVAWKCGRLVSFDPASLTLWVKEGLTVTPLYAAPPAPTVIVTDEMVDAAAKELRRLRWERGQEMLLGITRAPKTDFVRPKEEARAALIAALQVKP